MSLNRHRTFALTASGVLAGSTLCLVLAGPASADTTVPPLPTAVPSAADATPSTPDVSLEPVSALPTAPGGPIVVPAGNAGSSASGSDATAIILLSAGGVLVAGGGVVAARRRA